MGHINNFFNRLEWRWSLGNLAWTTLQGIGLVGSFALPAWAAKTTQIFAEYAPLSWVACGFLGLFVFTLSYWLFVKGRAAAVRARYNNRMYERSGFVDPMQKTFENMRIFLSDFCLPSHPLIEGRTFVNCEIIGPANIVFQFENTITEQRFPICDAVLLDENKQFNNAVLIRSCTFRQCSFQRVTLLFPQNDYAWALPLHLNWITKTEPALQTIEHRPDPPRLLPSTAKRKPRKTRRD